MSEPAYLSPKEVAAKLKDARCTSCKEKFTEEDFEQDEELIINQIVNEKVTSRRLAHYKCFFKKSTRPKMKLINFAEIMQHPDFSLVPSDYFDQEEEE